MGANVTGIWFVPFEIRTFELLTDPFFFFLSEGKKLKLCIKELMKQKS